MMYFIHNVNTYATTGKTQKGRILQEAAKSFENALLTDDALSAIEVSFRKLVKVLNDRLPGADLKVERSGGQIRVLPVKTSFERNHVFIISYCKVEQNLAFYHVREKIIQSLEKENTGIAGEFQKMIRSIIMDIISEQNKRREKGGEV